MSLLLFKCSCNTYTDLFTFYTDFSIQGHIILINSFCGLGQYFLTLFSLRSFLFNLNQVILLSWVREEIFTLFTKKSMNNKICIYEPIFYCFS